MDRGKMLFLVIVVVSVTTALYFRNQRHQVDEIEVVKLGVLTSTQRSFASEKFLTGIAIEEVNMYCENQSLPYRFEPVYKCENSSTPNAIDLTDRFHAENVPIVIGYNWGSMMDACDYQSKNYGMVLISPYSSAAVHRELYHHIFRLHPVTIHQTAVIAETMMSLGFNETIVFRETRKGSPDDFVNEFALKYNALGGEIKEIVRYPSSTDHFSINMSLARLSEAVNGSGVAILYSDTALNPSFLESLKYHPTLLNLTWFGNDYLNSNYTATLSLSPELASIQLIHPYLRYMDAPDNAKANQINDLYQREFNESMMFYTGNIYDAIWLSALTMIETGAFHNETFKETLPQLAKEYVGVTGNCSLDQYGDRVWGDYTLYNFVNRGDIFLKKIGIYDWEKREIEWKP